MILRLGFKVFRDASKSTHINQKYQDKKDLGDIYIYSGGRMRNLGG